MHLEEFAEGISFLHRLDPRLKFGVGMPMLLSVALMRPGHYFPLGTSGPFIALMLGMALCLLARLDAGKLMMRLMGINIFIVMIWFFLPFTTPGAEAFALGPLRATHEGLAYALMITFKTNAIALLSIAIYGTTEAMSLAHALVHMRVPPKLVHLFFFFYRYISVLHEEYTRLSSAMKLRSFRARGVGPRAMHTYRSLAYLLGMLIVRSHERSGRIYNAMLCRGFRGHFPVVSHFHFHPSDMLVASGGIIITGGFIILWCLS